MTASTRTQRTCSTSAAARTATRSDARSTSSSTNATGSRRSPTRDGVILASVRRLPAARTLLPAWANGELPGIGLLDAETVREQGPRLIGNVAIEVRAAAPANAHVLAGFENHGGRTYLGPGTPARSAGS